LSRRHLGDDAQAQSVPRVSKEDAQRVVKIISGDQAKTQTYCEIQKLTQQMEQAYEKNDSKTADELSEKIDTLEDTLGSEYAELINGLQDIDPEKDKLGGEIMSMFEALDRLCTK
jgi:prephenate dehydratase